MPPRAIPPPPTQDQAIVELVNEMVAEKRRYWSQYRVPEDRWLGPTLLLASPGPGGTVPRVWWVSLDGPASRIEEIMTGGGVRLEGAYREAFSLLYGYHPEVLSRVAEQLKWDPGQVGHAASNPQGWLRPLEKMNFDTMPIQDAVDFAVFLATVQIEMDRFLPGPPACGGPVDVMVMHTSPDPGIRFFPGKELHHP